MRASALRLHSRTRVAAQQMHHSIRGMIAEIAGAEVAERMRILYGGSAKPDNVAELLRQPDIDGGLVGGASLDAPTFALIVRILLEGRPRSQ